MVKNKFSNVNIMKYFGRLEIEDSICVYGTDQGEQKKVPRPSKPSLAMTQHEWEALIIKFYP